MSDVPNPDQLVQIEHAPPVVQGWMNAPLEIKKGIACWGSKPKNIEYIGLPNPREWSPFDEDWKPDGNPENNPLGAEKHWGLFTVYRKAKRVMYDLHPERIPENKP